MEHRLLPPGTLCGLLFRGGLCTQLRTDFAGKEYFSETITGGNIIIEQIWDFIRAAAPWVAMGLLVAIFAVRSAADKKNGKKSENNYGTEGMCLGMCFGTALGTALGNNTGIGISLGMLVGLAIGTCVPKRKEDADE